MDEHNEPRMDVRLAARLAEKKAELDQHRPLPAAVARRLGDDLRVLLTYNSNAIEGNTLSLSETKVVIETGLTIGGHNLREHLEATNHAEAYDYLIQLASDEADIDLDTILALHRLVMDKIDSTAGSFRSGQVQIVGASFTPPPARQVPYLIAAWLDWLIGRGLDYEPITRAAIAHHQFETIHPFTDGNGRTGRLLLGLMLMRAGYPPPLLRKEWRTSYISALNDGLRGNYNPLVNMIGRAVEGTLDLYLEAVRQEPTVTLQPLAALAAQSGYNVEYLGLLVRAGRLDAVKRRGRWYSSMTAIERYRAEVTQELAGRGRPPRRSGGGTWR